MDTSREFTKRNLMMGQLNDDDRHDRDPDNLDPENPLTWYPTKAPITSSPTASTANPTEKPVSTASPSRRPSRAPSRLPTAEPHSPTVPPTDNPTHNPSKVHVPTGNPTTIPSTSAPTISTASPTISVSPTCFIDTETGNFGDVLNLNANILGYVYEMETDPSSTASVSQDVIPSLEKQMLKFLIPNYFDNYCGSGDNTSRHLAIQKNFETGGTMMGISSFPADKVMTRGCQTTTTSETCTSIEGRMSIFVDGESSLIRSELMNAIERGMENDVFNNAHPSIRKLIFIGQVNDLAPTQSPVGDFTDDPTDGGSRSMSNGLMAAYVLLGVGSLITFAVAAQFIRRRRRNQRVADRGIGFYDEDLSSGNSSKKSFDEYIEFEPSNPHDLDTVVVSNRADLHDLEVNVDLESFESEEKAKDAGFNFFDLILQRSNPSSSRGNDREQNVTRDTIAQNDDLSEISF